MILPLEDGTPWPSRRLSKSFEHLAANAGVPQIRFRDLRLTHASQLLAGGKEVSVVQDRPGHARGSTTLNVY
ncbi:MAG TPA: tyrosine-type recombinase/integrase, partial [Armatimonadota bacterium]|nr:tyrosine-type recombinase/integrase [Armatimonadota bacterium]